MSDMQTAMLAAIPEVADRIPLSRQIDGAEQLANFDAAELARLDAAHSAEIVSLVGRIEAATDKNWIRRANQALRVLRLHQRWIAAELSAKRKRDRVQQQRATRLESAQIKEQNRQATAELQQRQHAERLARIRSANDETAQAIRVFKEVAREVLGMEMYEHLWELARQRTIGNS